MKIYPAYTTLTNHKHRNADQAMKLSCEQ